MINASMQQGLNTTCLEEDASASPSQEASLDQQYRQLLSRFQPFLGKFDKRIEKSEGPEVDSLDSFQSGFRLGFSTEMILAELVGDL